MSSRSTPSLSQISSLQQRSPATQFTRPFAPPTAAYLHIPFCRRRCHYCDFATGRGTPELIERYVQALCQQIQQVTGEFPPLQTVFFGGGTPSLLSGEQLQRIVDALRDRLGMSPTAEVSLEANPGTVSLHSLQHYRNVGINRISLGVQAFQPELLEACGRLHGVNEVYEAVGHLKAAGFDNFNLDLIFGLPHQRIDHWQYSLEEVVCLAPTHVSLYDLTIESGTRFGRLYQPGSQPLPSDGDTVEMYQMAIAILTQAGYQHYEVSNFARPNRQCHHNRVYWENRSYHGLGMGATGYVNGRRYEQPKTLADYFSRVEDGQFPTTARVTDRERLLDTLMLGLRLQEGLSTAELASSFSDATLDVIRKTLAPYRLRGWVEEKDGRLRLVSPDGWLFSNSILVDLMTAL
ncbi:MAG: radical SAM family heme chaperone HemW [Cyanobacteria bacterium P01_E01_bin.45]